MIGDGQVGKTSLVSQFLTSEHMYSYDASLDDEYGEKSLSVKLDGEEVELCFIDHPTNEMSVENTLTTYDPHAVILVFAVNDITSFNMASDTLQYLYSLNCSSKRQEQ